MHPFLPLETTLKDGSKATLRLVRPADAERVCELTRLIVQAGEGMVRTVAEIPRTAEEAAVGIRRQLCERRGVYIVADVGTAIVGQADVRVPPLLRLSHVGHFTVSVHPRYQGKGLGRALTVAAMQWAAEAGLAQVHLTVFASNLRARKLYESLGFEEEGVRRGYIRYEDGRLDDDVLMVWDPAAQPLAGATPPSDPVA